MGTHEHWWVLLQCTMSANGVPYLQMLFRFNESFCHSHECALLFISANECSWAAISNHVHGDISTNQQNALALDSTFNMKCWLLKILPFRILPMSRSTFHQMIKNLRNAANPASGYIQLVLLYFNFSLWFKSFPSSVQWLKLVECSLWCIWTKNDWPETSIYSS